MGGGQVRRGRGKSAVLLALVTALVLLLSGCPTSDGGGTGGGYHLRN